MSGELLPHEREDLEQDLTELELLAEELELRAVEHDLRKFIPLAWPIIEPHRPYIHNWHIDAIADHLMACTEGHIQNLVINIPPRHMKSITVSVFWPAWEWVCKPQTKWLFVSYSRGLVVRDSVKTRRIIQSEWYQGAWANRFQLAGDQNVKSYYENNKGGARIVGSIDSGITGEGGDRLVVDDPLKLEDADNKNAVDNANDFWDGVLSSRINDPATGVRVIIMQRLAENDLTGHVLKEGGWTHLMLPTEFEPDRKCFTFFARNDYRFVEKTVDGKPHVETQVQVVERSFEDPRTEPGELLNERRFGPEQVEQSRRRLGSWKFASQQQQSPKPAGGGIFKEEWWQFYEEMPSVTEAQKDAAMSWDASFKDLKTSSFCVGLCGTRIGPDIYLFHRRRERRDFPGLLAMIGETIDLYPWIGPKLIEDKANGTAAIQVLTSKVPGIIPRDPGQGGIEALARAITYLVEAGNVYLPGYREEGRWKPKYPWVKELIDECASFPRGEFNDQVAALAHMLYWYHERPAGGVELNDLLKEGEGRPADEHGWLF